MSRFDHEKRHPGEETPRVPLLRVSTLGNLAGVNSRSDGLFIVGYSLLLTFRPAPDQGFDQLVEQRERLDLEMGI